MQEFVSRDLRPSSQVNYELLIRRYIKPQLGSKCLNRLNVNDLRQWLKWLQRQKSNRNKPLSTRTVQFTHAVLRSALAWAVREELIGRNVAGLVSAPRGKSRRGTPLGPRKARKLIDVASDHWLAAMWLILLATGL